MICYLAYLGVLWLCPHSEGPLASWNGYLLGKVLRGRWVLKRGLCPCFFVPRRAAMEVLDSLDCLFRMLNDMLFKSLYAWRGIESVLCFWILKKIPEHI